MYMSTCVYLCYTKPKDMLPLNIHHYTFNIHGLQIFYTYKGEDTELSLCPGAVCDLLKDTKLIEDFTMDSNGEPVILYTDNKFPPGYGFEYWSAFVVFFPIPYRMALKLMEYREDRLASEQVQATIIRLLEPLQAA